MKELVRSWKSAGRADYKIVIDSQRLHTSVLAYVERERRGPNLTDQRAYDFFSVQQPGRAFCFNATVDL